MNNGSATYQGRLALNPDLDSFLSGYATLYNHVERVLYADMQRAGERAATFKTAT